ncbi:pyridine nucleotide-disulfide oxidoreductase [Pseudonocardia sediminis]|uniref:Pyridine nucleotide-disulfide oxidoreductase n=1 Tax=Pseudonocardia sediminis TaxID=1397368 RepID=A0A4Q7URV7_PSEST|nr:NAD(P)-binding domain-containing protein [Pseudonocardia sediminis]RZT84472.1 pyridine nucleotide-disulfide oxidoreductase [Pseudonocardia sediminis]
MRTDVVVIGAGQAGLSAASGLRRGGLEPGAGFVVLDGDDGPGGAWRHRWPTLRVDDAHRIHDLPGMVFSPDDPQRPAKEVVPEYFAAYEDAFDLQVRRPVHVTAVHDDAPDLRVETDAGTWTARALINATGTWTRPFLPHYPGAETFRGRQLHAVDYPGPGDFAGKRVVVVGGGTTAVQLLLEIAPHASSTTWVTRREPQFFDGPFDAEHGRAAVARVEERVRAGLAPESVVSVTGLARTDAVAEGLRTGVLDRHPMFDRITPDGVAWEDGSTEDADVILWATGWRPAVGHLAPLGLRGPGGGIALEGTRAVADPRVHLVGYGPSASTIGANRAGRAAAREVLALLRTSAAA